MGESSRSHTSTLEVGLAASIGRHYAGPNSVVFVVNNDRSFLSHRATWGAALQAAGATVTVVAEDTGEADAIRGLGFNFVGVRVGRESSSVAAMATASVQILISLIKIRPRVVFLSAQVAYTIGWPAAVLLRNTRFVRVVGGVGRALDDSALDSLASRVVRLSGGLASRLRNVYTLFQIEEDRNSFLRYGMLTEPVRSLVIAGTGIDVNVWRPDTPRDFTKPVIVFASRLYREKGVYEFVKVAEKLRDRGWRFQVVGDVDAGVSSTVTRDELEEWRRDGAVETLGRRNDMARVLAEATLLVFPTRHPEGTPKVLIEAGASGVPSIVSGHPGCRAVVKNGVTGVVLGGQPTVEELSASVEALASDATVARAMGDAARQHVSSVFSLEAVLKRLLEWEAVEAVRS